MTESALPRFSREQRLLAAVLAVLAVIGAGVVAWRIITRPDSSAEEHHVDRPYLVSLTETSMTVSRVEESAAGTSTSVVSTTELPPEFDAMVVADQGRWLMEDNPDTVFNYFDLSAAQPKMRSIELPFAGWLIERRTVRPGNDVVLLYSPDGSLGLAIVNLVDGTAYPLASTRTESFEAGSVRDYVLFKEVDGPNTIIIPEASPTTYSTMKGAVVDIRDTRTLVATADGPASYITIYDGLKQLGLRVQVENPIMGGMLTATGAVVLERTGGITVIDPLTAKVKRAGVSEFGAQGAIPVADDRLYGWGGDGSAILDAEGLQVESYPITEVLDDLGDPRPLVATNGGSGCLVLQPGPQLKPSGADALLIAVEDGAELLELDASPSWVSADGCTLVGLDSSVVINGKAVDVDLDQVFSVSPGRGSVLGRRDSASGAATFELLNLATKQVTELPEGFHLFAMF